MCSSLPRGRARDCSAAAAFPLETNTSSRHLRVFQRSPAAQRLAHIAGAGNRVNNDPEERHQMGLTEIEMCRKGPVPVFRSLTLLLALGSR
jgi:hypothetical protein